MSKIYLCWQNDCTLLGVADTEENARKMCSEFGDSYCPTEINVANRENVETTPLCLYNINGEFKTYKQVILCGYEFSKINRK